MSSYGSNLERRHTKEIQEILAKRPSWMFRWGIMLFSLQLVLVLAICSFVRYPDSIKASCQIVLTTGANKGYHGVILVSQVNYGKIKTGQRVFVQLTAYPVEQFGVLPGQISSISIGEASDTLLRTEVLFDNQSRSDIGAPVKLRQGLTGVAEIVTADASLLDRIFRNIRKGIRL